MKYMVSSLQLISGIVLIIVSLTHSQYTVEACSKSAPEWVAILVGVYLPILLGIYIIAINTYRLISRDFS